MQAAAEAHPYGGDAAAPIVERRFLDFLRDFSEDDGGGGGGGGGASSMDYDATAARYGAHGDSRFFREEDALASSKRGGEIPKRKSTEGRRF